ncbi:MAG: hypothetical protein EOP85_18310, partial [Verrucomicrobiaceae bacterium]
MDVSGAAGGLTRSGEDPCLDTVNGDLEKGVLKGVSRSFYLTLRLLPAPMRGAASLGYLLARTSDTLADTGTVPVAERLQALDAFARAVAEGGDAPVWTAELLAAVPDARERLLLESTGRLLVWLGKLPAAEAHLVREVVAIIISGQALDLERFATAGEGNVVALADDGELDDYTWRVAGCVGAFWTKLGFLTMGDRFSGEDRDILLGKGISYGKGLQLVNILRDVAEDLREGRCYLPVADTANVQELKACHRRWLKTARQWTGEGESYAATLRSRRLRAASLLPAWIARETLDRLDHMAWASLQDRI